MGTDMKPLTISIVTPTYNQAQFIGQTIENVLSQEGNFYIDYIIVNDGSTDDTVSVMDKYDKLLKSGTWPIRCQGISYRYWTRKNGGTPSAINEGLRATKGETLGWICSDDYYMPGVFEAVSRVFANDTDLDFVYGNSLKIYGDSRPPKIEPLPRPDETFESLRSRGNSFGFNFFSKKIFNKTGVFDESLNHCWDLDQWMRIFKVGKVKYLPVTFAAYRVWSGTQTGTKQKKIAEERRLIAKRYGGNVISPHAVYQWRTRAAFVLDTFQSRAPRLYEMFKNAFYTAVDLFKYSSPRP